MLKTIWTSFTVAAVGLSVCVAQETGSITNKSSNTNRSESVSPTSRATNAPNRNYSQDTNNAATKPADNTGRNVRDRDDATLTPEDQGASEADREMTRKIRRALTSNDQFSTTAKNIKIMTVNGKVTLRGPVQNEQEKQAIASLAESEAGKGSVDNQLELKTTNQ